MKRFALLLLFAVLFCLLTVSGCAGPEEAGFKVGVGRVDITPGEAVTLAGSPFPEKSSAVSIPLYAKAMIVSEGEEKAVVITLDTLKYPTSLAEQAMQAIEEETDIPADRIIITSSHTHSGPLYHYYNGSLTDSMVEAVKLALEDMEPCELGVASTEVTSVSHNRRLLVDGETWNTWMVKSLQARYIYDACGPIDTDLQMMAVIGKDGKYKAVLWNYACHASANSENAISADYPGYVEEYISEKLGYDVSALFLPGACGDINPNNSVANVGGMLGDGMLAGLENLEVIAASSVRFETKVIELPSRENPVFAEEEITEKWPETLESFRSSFDSAMATLQPTYKTYLCGIKIGNDFAIVTNPDELFCSLGLNIKESSPFKYTMVVEQTNGALGYVPAKDDFALKGYEAWFGEHSILGVDAGTMIRDESIDLLAGLQTEIQG